MPAPLFPDAAQRLSVRPQAIPFVVSQLIEEPSTALWTPPPGKEFEYAEFALFGVQAFCEALPGTLLRFRTVPVMAETIGGKTVVTEVGERLLTFQCCMHLLQHRRTNEVTTLKIPTLVRRSDRLYVSVDARALVWIFGAAQPAAR